ncbi:glutaredoxin family protein [Geomicrobium sp. JSM 1781026]|uniref:glutaredoxin family protein n=1 Tax=Geomicrobium sp. JSM 1781026 TaxID=3344580 RepID=UPI0035C0269D
MYQLTIYTRPMCSDCAKLKEDLARVNISFIEKDLEQQPEQEQVLKKKTGTRIVPGVVFKEKGILNQLKKPIVFTGYEQNENKIQPFIQQMSKED